MAEAAEAIFRKPGVIVAWGIVAGGGGGGSLGPKPSPCKATFCCRRLGQQRAEATTKEATLSRERAPEFIASTYGHGMAERRAYANRYDLFLEQPIPVKPKKSHQHIRNIVLTG